MRFEVGLVPSAVEDLHHFEAHEERIIVEGIREFLEVDADKENKRRKQLRANPLAPWELRVGDYRIFYEIRAGSVVEVLAVGRKVHNELFIRGRRAEI